jgi:hypothetical protein
MVKQRNRKTHEMIEIAVRNIGIQTTRIRVEQMVMAHGP